MVSKKLKIHTGIKGGKYYIKDGKKIYIKMSGGVNNHDDDYYVVMEYLNKANLKSLNNSYSIEHSVPGINTTIRNYTYINNIKQIPLKVEFNADITLMKDGGIQLTFIDPPFAKTHTTAMESYRLRSYLITTQSIPNIEKQDALNIHFLRLFRSRFSLGYPEDTRNIYVYKPSLCKDKSVSFWESLKNIFK